MPGRLPRSEVVCFKKHRLRYNEWSCFSPPVETARVENYSGIAVYRIRAHCFGWFANIKELDKTAYFVVTSEHRMFTYGGSRTVKSVRTGEVLDTTFATFRKTGKQVQTPTGIKNLYAFVNLGPVPMAFGDRLIDGSKGSEMAVPICQAAEWGEYDGQYAAFGHEILVAVHETIVDNEAMFGLNLHLAAQIERMHFPRRWHPRFITRSFKKLEQRKLTIKNIKEAYGPLVEAYLESDEARALIRPIHSDDLMEIAAKMHATRQDRRDGCVSALISAVVSVACIFIPI